jgi:hypothetical protein
MSNSFTEFDLSYWRTKDKAWLAEREQAWRQLQILLHGLSQSKKCKAISKRYFMKGTLPDWHRHLNDEDSPLNLMLFLYLHPSRDEHVLKVQRDLYLNAPVIQARDVLEGMSNLLTVGAMISSNLGYVVARSEVIEKELPDLAQELESLPPIGSKPPYIFYKILVLHTEGNNEKLFSLLWPSPPQRTLVIAGGEVTVPAMDLDLLWTLSRWLTLPEPLNAGSQDMLFQYELPREAWYAQAVHAEVPSLPQFLELLLAALYRIYNFDQVAEGETPRTRFVQAMIEMFDSRDFTLSFKDAWAHVKAGELEVKDAWSNDVVVTVSSLLNKARMSP